MVRSLADRTFQLRPVPVAPLADVLAALGVDRVDLLVLDCEGCEHAVLASDGWKAMFFLTFILTCG